MPTVSVCVKQTGCAADKYLTLNRMVVVVVAFYSDDPDSNPGRLAQNNF